MENAFICACTIMTALLIWGLGWYYLLASGFATIFMLTLFKTTDPN